MEDTAVNDYAVAHNLNLLVMGLITLVYIHKDTSISDNLDVQEINRVYILLVDELQKLYDSNSKLSELKPEPIWRRFEVIKFHIKEIQEHVAIPENGHGGAHFAKVERLCILSNANIEAPKYTPEQEEVVNDAHSIMNDFDMAHEARKNNKVNNWQIPEYTLAYKPDGTILINNVLKLKKAHAGSTTERLMEHVVKNPNKLTKPDLKETSRNLSTVLHSAGFTKELKQLFFPTVSSDKGVIFRPVITRKQADNEKIDTMELDQRLKELGAETELKNL